MKIQCALTLFFFLISISLANSQVVETLAPNDAAATFRADGVMFANEDFTETGLAIPFEYGVEQPKQIYYSNLVWTGVSQDPTEEINGKIADQIYNYFLPGPVNNLTGQPSEDADTLYNRVWTVYGEDILKLINDYEDNNQIDSLVELRLLIWPGRNNPHLLPLLGFQLPNQDLAPFFDRNLDDIYNPEDGDYPIIDEAYADIIPNELTFSVYNDFEMQDFPHEYHLMTFGFRCADESSEINNTIFTKNTFINKSNHDYANVNIGLHIDFDLGCPSDDFLGSAPNLNSTYAYNQDAVDGVNGDECVIFNIDLETFGDNPGTVSSTVLNHPMTSAVYGSDNIAGSQLDYLHYNLNGIQVRRDQNNNLILDTIGILYPDFPSDSLGDHAINDNILGFDIRSAMGSFIGDVLIGEQVVLYHAWYANEDETRTAHQEPDVLKTAIPNIQQFFDDGFANSCTQILDICDDDCVWPGDVNRDDRVFHDDFIIARYGINQGFVGPERVYPSSRFKSFNAMDWMTPITAISNAKHIDCYGDGEADLADRFVVRDNYGKQTPSALPFTPVLPPTTDQGITFDLFKNRIEENSPLLSRVFVVNRLSILINPDLASIISGISFSIYFDETYVDVEGINFNNFPNTFFETGSDEEIMYAYIPEENRIDIAISSSTNDALESELTVPNLSRWALKSDLQVPEGQDRLFIPFPIHDLHAIDTGGNMVELGFIQDSLFLVRDLSSTKEVDLDHAVIISPVPAQDKLTLQLMYDVPFVALEFLNSNGKTVRSQAIESDKFSMSIGDLPNGIYMLHLTTKNGSRAIKKVVVMNK